MHGSKILYILFIALILSSCDKGINSVNNAETVTPGRRDYVWSVDTLKIAPYEMFLPTRIWGNSPTDVWIVGSGTSSKYSIWHFDGAKWRTDSIPRNIDPMALWGTSAVNIWMGNVNGAIWRFDGTQWSKFGDYKLSGYDYIALNEMWGSAWNDLWGSGFAAHNGGLEEYCGALMHYDGNQWKFASIPTVRFMFDQIRRQNSTGKYFLTGVQYEPTGNINKVYSFDGVRLQEIFSSTTMYAYIMDLNGEVYFSLGKSIYTYYENEFHLFVDLSSTLFPGARRGRSEKDIFTNGEGGLGHFNGSDFKIIYELSSNYRISDIFLFPSDVFFMCYTFDYNSGIVIHGKLKNSVAESH